MSVPKGLNPLLSLLVKMELRTVTISSKGQIALPKKVRTQIGFKEGDKVVILEKQGRLEILPANSDDILLRSLLGCMAPIRRRTHKEREKDLDEFLKQVRPDSAQ